MGSQRNPNNEAPLEVAHTLFIIILTETHEHYTKIHTYPHVSDHRGNTTRRVTEQCSIVGDGEAIKHGDDDNERIGVQEVKPRVEAAILRTSDSGFSTRDGHAMPPTATMGRTSKTF